MEEQPRATAETKLFDQRELRLALFGVSEPAGHVVGEEWLIANVEEAEPCEDLVFDHLALG